MFSAGVKLSCLLSDKWDDTGVAAVSSDAGVATVRSDSDSDSDSESDSDDDDNDDDDDDEDDDDG